MLQWYELGIETVFAPLSDEPPATLPFARRGERVREKVLWRLVGPVSSMASMIRTLRRWRWWQIGAGVFFGIVGGTWLGLMTYAPASGSIEDTFFRVHAGTGMHEAAEALKGYRGSIDYGMVQGITKDGRSFLDYGFDRLPPPSEIDRFKLELGTECGECIVVDIGTGGRVTVKHFSSESWWQERLVNAQNMIRR